jgi:hypothetical protein
MRTPTKTKRAAHSEICFQSILENWAEGMDYCAIPVPAKVTKSLGTTAAVLVIARVNDSEPFKVSLFPAGGGKHYIRVRKRVRTAAKIEVGDRLSVKIVVLDRDADAVIPKDVEKALRTNGVLKAFKTITPGARNYILRRITDAARPETREKRILEAVDAAIERSKV